MRKKTQTALQGARLPCRASGGAPYCRGRVAAQRVGDSRAQTAAVKLQLRWDATGVAVRWWLVSGSLIVAIACGVMLVRTPPAKAPLGGPPMAQQGAASLTEEPVPPGATASPEGPARPQALQSLRALRMGSRALNLLQQRYVEPEKFKPQLMLEEALQSVAHLVPQMLVDVPQRDGQGQPLQLRLRIASSVHLLDLRQTDDLYRVGWHLLDALRFVADHLPPDVAASKIEYTAINGVLSTLDPYSRALDPDQWRDMQTNTGGNFGGLGIVILPIDGVLTIQTVLADSPAARAGLLPGDQILQIDGEDTLNMAVDKAVERLRGEIDTTARLMVQRKNWPQAQLVQVVRAVIHLQSVESKVLDNGIGYAKIKNFQRGTAAELGEAIDNLQRAGAHPALVLDLRDNPGGLLDEAIRVCDLFIASGPAVTTVTAGQQRDVRAVTGNGRYTRLPLAVLQNGHSASASEVVAGALKYANRAIVLGEQSFGKGSVQVPFEIDDGALKLTVAKYLVPGDRSIHGKGIEPDIGIQFVSATREQVSLFGGPQYSRAARKARAALASQPPPPPKVLLKVLLPDATDHSRSDAESPTEVIEREPRQRAAAILRRAGQASAAATWAAAQADLHELRRADDAALIDHLKRQGIDWRAGESVAEPALRVEIVDRDKGLHGMAGEILRMAVTLTNLGRQPLHRLHLQTRCDDSNFDGHEQLVGRLDPGQRRTVPLSIRVSIRHGDVRLPLHVVAAQDGRLLQRQDSASLTVEGRALPEFTFRAVVDDTDSTATTHATAADGVLQPDERAKLVVTVRNSGEGLAQAGVLRVRSLSGQRLHLGEGRARLGPLAAGAETTVQLPIRAVSQVPREMAEHGQPVQVELVMADETLGAERTEVVDLPWTARPLSETPARQRQAVQKLLEVGQQWNAPPRVSLSDTAAQLEVDANGCWYPLSATANFDPLAPAQRFAVASVNGDKQQVVSGVGRATLPIQARLRLDSGLNVVTISGQAGVRRSADRQLLVHCADQRTVAH
jgi:carboxyl-terminal processing protease